MRKNKLLIGIIILVVVIIVVGGAAFLIARSKSRTTSDDVSTTQQSVKTLKPEDIGFQAKLSDPHNALMDVTKLDGIKSIEYSVTFDALVKDSDSGEEVESTQGYTNGNDPIAIKSGQSKYERKFYLGSCSAQCTPFQLASDIDFVIKVNYENGEVGQLTTTLPYPNKISGTPGSSQ